jgi:hypothetical protein
VLPEYLSKSGLIKLDLDTFSNKIAAVPFYETATLKDRITLIYQYLAGSKLLYSRRDLSSVLILADFNSDIGAVSI